MDDERKKKLWEMASGTVGGRTDGGGTVNGMFTSFTSTPKTGAAEGRE